MWCRGECTLLLVFLSFTHGQNDVRMPPYITKGPRGYTIFRPGDSVTLECEGAGIPYPSYEWKKNGLDLNYSLPNIKVIVESGDNVGHRMIITIEGATSIDEGYYQCFVRNDYGTALSNTFHIQGAFLDSTSMTSTVHEKTVNEGEPFFIGAQTRKSFPKPIYDWEIANDAVDNKPIAFNPSSRIQIDDNGNLHFAYAKPEDDLSGRLYKCTTYNQYLDKKAPGNNTKVIINVFRANNSQTFAPTIGFSSEPQTVGIIGQSVSLRCFFYGKPEPTISWKGPGNSLPANNRWKLDKFNSELIISDITASDQGDYVCSASNTKGQNSHTLQLRVEAKPSFKTLALGPYNINVTDGEDAVFTCKAEAIPEAKIVWLQNEIVLDFNVPPKKFSFSSDRKTLTIRSVCRNCGDPDRQTDLSVIQCNASNIHGYVFGSGYLNVLAKTQIIPADRIEVSVGIYEEKRFDFDCSAVSDPSTPVTVRWYRLIEGGEQLVYNEPPFITLKSRDGEQSLTLSIFVSPNGTVKWLRYHGQYRCNASNGYSNAAKWASIKVIYAQPPVKPEEQDKGIVLILKSSDPHKDTLSMVLQQAEKIYEMTRDKLNELCSGNVSLCCGTNYTGNSTHQIEFVALGGVYGAQGRTHNRSDGTVSVQIIAVVDENVDRTVCRAYYTTLRPSRGRRSFVKRFVSFASLLTAISDIAESIKKVTGLTVEGYEDPSIKNNSNSGFNDCTATKCVIPLLIAFLNLLAAIFTGIMCYRKRRGKKETPANQESSVGDDQTTDNEKSPMMERAEQRQEDRSRLEPPPQETHDLPQRKRTEAKTVKTQPSKGKQDKTTLYRTNYQLEVIKKTDKASESRA